MKVLVQPIGPRVIETTTTASAFLVSSCGSRRSVGGIGEIPGEGAAAAVGSAA